MAAERQAVSSGSLSLAAGALPEFPPERVAEAAVQAGFDHVGFTIDPQAWSDAMAGRLRHLLDATALNVLDVEVVWIPPGGRLNDGHRRIVEAGAELGAANVLTVSDEPDPARAGAALHELCEWAAPHGMRVALEFLMITSIRRLDQALAVIGACAHPAAALLVDALHLQRAGHRPADLAAVPPALLSYAQLCDGNAACETTPEGYLKDALDLRDTPGDGELPLDDLLDRLPDGCPLSLEIRSRRYRQRFPDPGERAAEIRRRTLAFLNRR